MYYSLSSLAGVLIAVMVVLNGGLTGRAGQPAALLLIHLAGAVVMGATMLLRREKLRHERQPFYLYIGGFIGVVTVLSNNLSFGRISVSAILALSLLGESLGGLFADNGGWLGTPKRAFKREKLWGALLTLIGIVFMLSQWEPVAVLLSMLAGFTVLVSRLINGKLARNTSVPFSTLMNYVTGLSLAFVLYLLRGGAPDVRAAAGLPLPYYLGGALGACIVLISNRVVGRIPSVYMTLALFVGQVFAGLMLDAWLSNAFSSRTLAGGLLVLAGLCLSLWQDGALKPRAKGGTIRGKELPDD